MGITHANVKFCEFYKVFEVFEFLASGQIFIEVELNHVIVLLKLVHMRLLTEVMISGFNTQTFRLLIFIVSLGCMGFEIINTE